MRTVLIGSDFVYDKNGNLRPIEINTAVGWDYYKLEDNATALNVTAIKDFISENSFTKIIYIGAVYPISEALTNIATELGIEYVFEKVRNDAVTIPNVEDNDTTLIIRSAYDTTALVDDTYCRNKVNFLSLLQGTVHEAQFAYMNTEGTLVSNITTIPDNGNHPNFILKAVYPGYDKKVYPKLYRVTSTAELETVLQNVDENYFLMEFYVNENELAQSHLKVYRHLSILYPPSLEVIPFGAYTRITEANLTEGSVYDENTFELEAGNKLKYITSDTHMDTPKLADGDWVEMADGTFKSAEDLQIGDLVRTLDIPNPTGADVVDENVNYKISYDEFVSETTYSVNRITAKIRMDKLTDKIKLTFTDGTEWYDTRSSYYLCLQDNEIRFLAMNLREKSVSTFITVGTQIVLVDTTSVELKTVIKEVASIEATTEMFNGWGITVENRHLFLTKTGDENTGNSSYVSIEHNLVPCYYGVFSCAYTPAYCGKSQTCCGQSATCRSYCFQCPQK